MTVLGPRGGGQFLVAGGEAVCVRQRNAICNLLNLFRCIGLGKIQDCAVRLCLRMAVFPQKGVDSFRGPDLQRMPLLHSHVNRVTLSLTRTLPMANSGCLCPVIVAGWRGRSPWRCKVIADNTLRRCRPPPIPCFRWRCGGRAVAGPLHWRAGWQTGSLARPIALNAYFCIPAQRFR
jgi:hypothetical protein